MADRVRLLHQLSRLAEVGVRTGGVDKGADLTLSDDRSGEHRLAGSAGGRQRLAGQRGLIHLDGVARKQARICRHDVAQAEADHVARDQLACRRRDPLSVAFHSGHDGQFGFEGSDGFARLSLFPESDHGVGDEQDQDDDEIWPVLEQPGKDHRHLDHPWDRTPEVGEEFQVWILLPCFDLVGPVLSQPFLCFGLTQSLRR